MQNTDNCSLQGEDCSKYAVIVMWVSHCHAHVTQGSVTYKLSLAPLPSLSPGPRHGHHQAHHHQPPRSCGPWQQQHCQDKVKELKLYYFILQIFYLKEDRQHSEAQDFLHLKLYHNLYPDHKHHVLQDHRHCRHRLRQVSLPFYSEISE